VTTTSPIDAGPPLTLIVLGYTEAGPDVSAPAGIWIALELQNSCASHCEGKTDASSRSATPDVKRFMEISRVAD